MQEQKKRTLLFSFIPIHQKWPKRLLEKKINPRKLLENAQQTERVKTWYSAFKSKLIHILITMDNDNLWFFPVHILATPEPPSLFFKY